MLCSYPVSICMVLLLPRVITVSGREQNVVIQMLLNHVYIKLAG